MTCKKCGTYIPDGVEFCEKCIAEQVTVAAVPEKKSKKEEKQIKKEEKKQAKIEKKKMKKANKKKHTFRNIVLVFVALIIAFGGCCAAMIVPNYDWLTVVYDYYQALEVCDAKALVEMNAGFINASIRDEYTIPEDKLDDVFAKKVDSMLEEMEDEYGKNIDFSFVITDVDRHNDFEIERLIESFEENEQTAPYIEGVVIEEWIGVDLDMRASGDEKTDYYNATINLYKINGAWCVAHNF